MAGVCCGATGESETSASVKPNSSRKRKTEIRQLKFVADTDSSEPECNSGGLKLQKFDLYHQSLSIVEKKCSIEAKQSLDTVNKCGLVRVKSLNLKPSVKISEPTIEIKLEQVAGELVKFGLTSVCGRRRDMEDAVSIHPSFCKQGPQITSDFHFFGVYDGHGCSHVASKCKARMHEIVKEEIEKGEESWKNEMERSFLRMDREVQEWRSAAVGAGSSCRCELQTPRCDGVGSTAVVSVVTPHKIIVSNCGDSRAVLSRNGVAVPLSSDHKPDRPDELNRIQSAGGRVIYWDGPRVLGVLAMSRAIGDNYLKPYVIPDPEVTITDRTPEDECLILASDGLWDVVSNETACGVARMCLNSRRPLPIPQGSALSALVSAGGESSDKACMDASILLTKLAMARQSTDNVSVVVVDFRRNLN